MSVEAQLSEGVVHLHGLFERPLRLDYKSHEDAEEALRRAATLFAAELRRTAIATADEG